MEVEWKVETNLNKKVGDRNGNCKICDHWRRALHKIGYCCASCLLCIMHEVMIISFLHALELCSLAIIILVMCMSCNGYMYESVIWLYCCTVLWDYLFSVID